MKRKWFITGISIIAVILLTLTSLSNVVGYQTVQTSQQNVINERINQGELLFQTICDIANNKEIQRIILKEQMSRGIFPTSDIPVVTKQQIRQMYFIGLILSKAVSKLTMQSMVQQKQLINPEIQKEINVVIEKDMILKGKITQLSNSNCYCEDENIPYDAYPIICTILYLLCIGALILTIPFAWFSNMEMFFLIISVIFFEISQRIECKWSTYVPP
jgi:hypothetical protein